MAAKLSEFLGELGIDPLYFVTLIAIVISLSYLRHWDDWDSLAGYRKRWIGTVLITTAILVFFSLVRFACNNM